MSFQLVRRAAVALTVVAVGVFGIAGAASAHTRSVQPATATIAVAPTTALAGSAVWSASSPGETAIQPMAFTVTYDKYITQALYIAALGSVGAFRASCDTLPSGLRTVCIQIADWAVPSFLRLGPPDGRCLRGEPQFGWPPIRVSYVNC